MRITRLRTLNFRNLAELDLRFDSRGEFFLGNNGQGKTNVLEALHLVSALRSFRTQDLRALRQWNKTGDVRILIDLDHPRRGPSEVEIRLDAVRRSILVDGDSVTRFGDFLGVFPTVVFCSEDVQLLRGAPQLRRRFLDLTISAVDAQYFDALRRYHRALRERNAGLRSGLDARVVRPYERILAECAIDLRSRREQVLGFLNEHLCEAYRMISPEEESPAIEYRPSGVYTTADEFLELLNTNRERDVARESTGNGPHRDNIAFRLKDHRAREYASEGQQRGLALSLRFAQWHWIHQSRGVMPVVLADDILGELDPRRQDGFWKAVGDCPQIFATGTRPPSEREGFRWRIWNVTGGVVTDNHST